MGSCRLPHGPSSFPDWRGSVAVTPGLLYCCFATWFAAVVLHLVQRQPCIQTGENQLLSLLDNFTAVPGVQLWFSTWSRLVPRLERISCVHYWLFIVVCYLVCSCRPPHGSSLCPDWKNQLLPLLVNITTVPVVLHMVQPRGRTGENQLLLLLVNFTTVCYLVCSCHLPHGPASCPDWREPASTIPGSAIPAPSPKGGGCFASASEWLPHSCFKRKQRLLDSVKIHLSVLSPHW